MFNIQNKNSIYSISFKPNSVEIFFKYILLIVLCYWLVIALLSPVTLWDSNVYNIARLELHLRDGLFRNKIYNDPRQIYMTWTFDAVHLPFRILGYGEGLPSFACFLGIILIVYRITLQKYNKKIALITSTSLLGMPCLVYQITSTKPDIAVIFSIAVWYYAFHLYNKSKEFKYLLLICLSLGFASGAKASGLLIAPFLGLATLFQWRNDLKACLNLFFYSLLAFVFWGSIEIYINNIYTFGHIFAPPGNDARNYDGLLGGLATFIRYIFSNTTFGLESFFISFNQLTNIWEYICRKTLYILHINNLGMQLSPYIRLDDSSMRFIKNGTETCSDYGIIGSAALWTAIYVFFRDIFRRNFLWWISLFSISNLILFSIFVGWGLWSNRYLVISFVPITVILCVQIETINIKLIKILYICLILLSIIFTPITSFNRRPVDIVSMIEDRNSYQIREKYSLLPIIKEIESLVNNQKKCKIILCAGEDAWILPFFNIKGTEIIPIPFRKLDISNLIKIKANYLLLLDNSPLVGYEGTIKMTHRFDGTGGFWGRSSYLYTINNIL
jgi:Dolichyl-phosphate-mannose-protein mannosyltransferase